MPAAFDTSGVVYAPRSNGCLTGRYPWRWEELGERVQGLLQKMGQGGQLGRYRDTPPDLLAALLEGRDA